MIIQIYFTHWIWGWVNSRAGLDVVEKGEILPVSGFKLRPSSLSLYRQNYPFLHLYTPDSHIRCQILTKLRQSRQHYVNLSIKFYENIFSGSEVHAYCHVLGFARGLQTVFWLDVWIYRALYIHNSGLQAIQNYRCSAHFTLHRYTRTKVLNLH
jgi:hypothetical protein